MTKSITIWTAVLLGATVLLTACGKNDTEKKQARNAAPAASTDATAAQFPNQFKGPYKPRAEWAAYFKDHINEAIKVRQDCSEGRGDVITRAGQEHCGGAGLATAKIPFVPSNGGFSSEGGKH